MKSTNNQIRFLGTFDESGGTPAQPQVIVVPQTAPAAPQPVATPPEQPAAPAVFPVSALPTVLSTLANREREAAAAVAAARAQQSPNPEPTQQVLDNPPQDQTQGRVTNIELQKQLNQMHEALHTERMERYRAEAINKVRADGKNLIDGIVMGKTKEEIDSSLLIAQAEYDLVASRVAQDLQQQFQPAGQQAQQPDAQGYVSQVGGQAVAPPPHQQQMAQQPLQPQQVSAPSFVQAPGVPQQPQQDMNAMLQQVTSSAGIRNGQYGMFRDQIMSALRNQAPGPGGGKWSFLQSMPVSPQLAAPAPQMVPAPVNQQQPLPGPYAGQQPQMVQQPPSAAFGAQNPMQPQFQQAAPQPADLERGAALNPQSARAAAEAAVASRRPRAAGLPNIHS